MYGTSEKTHPGVRYLLYSTYPVYIGGTITALPSIEISFDALKYKTQTRCGLQIDIKIGIEGEEIRSQVVLKESLREAMPLNKLKEANSRKQ